MKESNYTINLNGLMKMKHSSYEKANPLKSGGAKLKVLRVILYQPDAEYDRSSYEL